MQRKHAPPIDAMPAGGSTTAPDGIVATVRACCVTVSGDGGGSLRSSSPLETVVGEFLDPGLCPAAGTDADAAPEPVETETEGFFDALSCSVYVGGGGMNRCMLDPSASVAGLRSSGLALACCPAELMFNSDMMDRCLMALRGTAQAHEQTNKIKKSKRRRDTRKERERCSHTTTQSILSPTPLFIFIAEKKKNKIK